jgi:hypothetical protein
MRDFLSRTLFSPLQGMGRETWRSLLRQEGHSVDPPYRARAAFQSALTVFNSAVAAVEDSRHGPAVEAAQVHPPLFILGHWRHGTTHLHNLLALDPRFAYPNLYQTLYPRTFLTTQRVVPRLGGPLPLRRRPHDDVALGFGVPNEDELAVLNDAGLSPYLAWAFPRRAEAHDRFLTFRDATEEERDRWRASLLRFVKKLTLRHDRPLVLKSSPHTARIGLLLGLFPDARFVHIRRDPYAVFRSMRHMYAVTMRYWRIQTPSYADHDARIIDVYREMYDTYFEQRGLIPAGHFCEVAYEDLERDPVGQLGAVYDALDLPDFDLVWARVREYLGTVGGYRKNVHPELPEPLRRRISGEWGWCFEAWGYTP